MSVKLRLAGVGALSIAVAAFLGFLLGVRFADEHPQ